MLSGDEIRRLVQDLASPRVKTRSRATEMLMGMSDQGLPVLAEAYSGVGQLEPRLRLRGIIEYLFYQRQLEGRMGFLGISPRVEVNIHDPQTGKAADALFIARVIQGHPAEKAGVRAGDMVLEFDGKPISDIIGAGPKPVPRPGFIQQQAGARQPGLAQRIQLSDSRLEAFTAEVSRREPGSVVSLRLLRVTGSDRERTATLGDEPSRSFQGATLAPIIVPNLQFAFDPLVGPSLRPGLAVAAVAAGSPADQRGLKAGDVILGAGRGPLGPNVLPENFEAILKTSRPGATIRLLLSHVEQVKLNVTLGGRPVDLMNLTDMEIAHARFAEWWKGLTGEASFRDSTSPYERQMLPPPRAVSGPTVLP
jgi:hypothetical protein